MRLRDLAKPLQACVDLGCTRQQHQYRMGERKLYGDLMSQPTRAVLIFCRYLLPSPSAVEVLMSECDLQTLRCLINNGDLPRILEATLGSILCVETLYH